MGLPNAARNASTVAWIEDVAADPPTSKNMGAAATGAPMATIAANMTAISTLATFFMMAPLG